MFYWISWRQAVANTYMGIGRAAKVSCRSFANSYLCKIGRQYRI